MNQSEVLNAIRNTNSADMNDLLMAVAARYRELFPDWEILFISCPKYNQPERKQTPEYIIRYLESTRD